MNFENSLKKTLFLFFFTLPFLSFSQRNAPVVGDAAKLIDLLKKDYSTISLDRRKDEIVKDQVQVISYFKAYLTDVQKAEYAKRMSASNMENITTSIGSKHKIHAALKSELDAMSGQALRSTSAAEITQYSDSVNKLKVDLANAKDDVDNLLNSSNVAQLTAIGEIYKESNNLFLDTITQLFIQKYENLAKLGTDELAVVNHSSSIKKAIPFIGGNLSFETVIDGLGRFLAQRLKDELTAYVFTKIHDWLDQSGETDPFAELKVILPRTTNYLKNLEASGISTFGEEIKQYIEDDLNTILENSVNLKDTPRFKKWIKNYPDLDFAFEALELIPAISELKSPIEYFALLENSRNISRWKADTSPVKHNLANTMVFSSMLAHSLMVMDDNESRFAGIDFLSSYVGEEAFMKLFIGFLYQQNEKYYDIHFLFNKDVKGKENELTEIGLKTGLFGFMKNYDKVARTVSEKQKDMLFFKDLIMEMGEKGESVYQNAIEIRRLNKLNEEVQPELVHGFIDGLIGMTEHAAFTCDTVVNYLFASLDMFEGIKELKDSLDTTGKKVFPLIQVENAAGEQTKYVRLNLKEKAQPFLSMARTCNGAFLDIVDKKYALAILKILEVSGSLISEESEMALFSEVQAFTDQLFKNSEKMRELSWRDLYKIIQGAQAGKTVDLNENQRKTITTLLGELNKIMIFGDENALRNAALYDSLNKLKEEMIEMVTKRHWDTPESADNLKELKGLFSNRNFKNLLISYYAGQSINAYAEKLKGQLAEIEINGFKPFSTDEASQFSDLIKRYGEVSFKYVMEAWRDNGAKYRDFEELNEELKQLIKNYALLLPEKLNWEIHPNVIKIVHFINDVAMAENGEDISAIIDQFALPPGSSSIKRKSYFNVSLNAYPGLLTGWDVVLDKGEANAWSLGFTAPVGLSFAWGTERECSHGMFISIIDVGAITRFRFTNDSTATILSDLRFQDVFAPGAYYSLGFKNTPLSLNIGAQYGPDLRAILPDGSGTFLTSMRFGVGLVVDIPLVNLHTKPRF